ncbi:hypothetical protein GN958_ATG13655 [Phytophthora infestans]|uniref:Uncharacterized protein n=1 Tax=Phytophthora infestans TaxID=4787 RepID=A0A8S9UCH3_PHYIN|nr:hypothetical protein GN958_ATG13655 [Phytophthora infestans]
MLLITVRLPSPIGSNAVAPCSVEDIIAFGNFNDPRQPIRAYLRQLPNRACLFDSTTTAVDAVISRRTRIVLCYFHIWRSLRRRTGALVLAITVLVRHHWVSQRAVWNMARAILWSSSFHAEVAEAILPAWDVYFKHRKQRTDVL